MRLKIMNNNVALHQIVIYTSSRGRLETGHILLFIPPSSLKAQLPQQRLFFA